MSTAADTESKLAEEVSNYYADPLGFVLAMFPWGVQGTMLEPYEGPRRWQWEYLEALGAEISSRGFDGIHAVDPIQMAVASGHGIGKSALTSWLLLFIMSTRPYCKGVVTSNTSDQLRTKTWAELGKWHRICNTGHWFAYNAAKGHMSLVHKKYPEIWRVDAQTCKEENSESFAGLHAANSTPFYVFDEASAIPDMIWEVSDGGLTDGEPMRLAFGNPTRNSGRFRECFGKMAHRWKTFHIDSRDVHGTNKKLLDQWVEDYGDDSDFVRVRVRGVFPRAGSLQFVPGDLVRMARTRNVHPDVYEDMPKLLAVDVARFGDDKSVTTRRQGRKVWPQKKYRGLSTMELANYAAEEIREWEPDAVFVDGVGVGGGVVDRLRQMGYDVIDVQAGESATDKKKYRNKRAEMWDRMREFLKDSHPDLPEDNELETALTTPEYGFTVSDQLLLESKKDMKARGCASPDEADSLAMTFAEHISSKKMGRGSTMAETEYDLYE